VEVLVRSGALAVDRDGKVAHAQFGHWCAVALGYAGNPARRLRHHRAIQGPGTTDGHRSARLRNALLPLITIISLRLQVFVGGAILIEAVFQWPDMGQLSVQAIQQRD
jgi:hypothetical protein